MVGGRQAEAGTIGRESAAFSADAIILTRVEWRVPGDYREPDAMFRMWRQSRAAPVLFEFCGLGFNGWAGGI